MNEFYCCVVSQDKFLLIIDITDSLVCRSKNGGHALGTSVGFSVFSGCPDTDIIWRRAKDDGSHFMGIGVSIREAEKWAYDVLSELHLPEFARVYFRQDAQAVITRYMGVR